MFISDSDCRQIYYFCDTDEMTLSESYISYWKNISGVTILQITHPKLQSRNIFFVFFAKYTSFFFGIVHNRLLRVWWLWKITEFKIGLGVILIYMSMISCYCYFYPGIPKMKHFYRRQKNSKHIKSKELWVSEEFLAIKIAILDLKEDLQEHIPSPCYLFDCCKIF